MKSSKTAIIFIISMLLLSIFIANILNIQIIQTQESTNSRYQRMTNKTENLMWFLQITDIHISIFRDPFRITQFKEFCDYTLDAIKPEVVLASGDLTDAKTKDGIGSEQFQREWQYYLDTLKSCKAEKKTLWLDIRGNHDNFNVASKKSKQNFYTNYSIQGRLFPGSYMYQITKDNQIYSFAAIDACLEPGPKRPFNFIGMLDEGDIDDIDKMLYKLRRTGSNHTIWFGHFPTSCILSSGKESVREMIGKDPNSLVYLCGHLHTLGGLVPNMYVMQKEGFLELELGDWKDNRKYRLLAVDHGIFSFTDLNYNEWPVVLVTNPKDAMFVNPRKENFKTFQTSTHIRVLAFSLSPISTVKVRLNDKSWLKCENVKGPLYVAPWDPSLFSTGLHHIQVYVKDEHGRVKTFFQSFSIDGTTKTFSLLPRIALLSDASTVFRLIFVIVVFISILPLIFFRSAHYLVTAQKVSKPRSRNNCCSMWIRKLWILSTIDRLYWPMLLYPFYISFGPWAIGYIIEDHLGVIFSWGIFVYGSYLPGSFTYVYGAIQLLTFHVPLTYILAHIVDMRFQCLIIAPGKKVSKLKTIGTHLPFWIICSIQVAMAYLFWLAYGTLAFLLGPLRTWSLVLALVLWHFARKASPSSVQKAVDVWACKYKEDSDASVMGETSQKFQS